MPTETTPKKQQESGHTKIVESLGKLVAFSETIDQTKLDPPPEMTIAVLQGHRTTATALQTSVGNSRADWRTIALDRALDIEKFAPLASQAVGALAGRGASKEKVDDAMFYVRKLQGRRAKAKPKDDPNTPNLDESEKGVSASQQSSAALITTMYELVDFLEAQSEYAAVKVVGLTPSEMRTTVDTAQAKHNLSITSVAALSSDRRARNKFFYLDPVNICDIAKQFKNLVKGAFGANSLEYKTVNAIKFKKPKL